MKNKNLKILLGSNFIFLIMVFVYSYFKVDSIFCSNINSLFISFNCFYFGFYLFLLLFILFFIMNFKNTKNLSKPKYIFLSTLSTYLLGLYLIFYLDSSIFGTFMSILIMNLLLFIPLETYIFFNKKYKNNIFLPNFIAIIIHILLSYLFFGFILFISLISSFS